MEPKKEKTAKKIEIHIPDKFENTYSNFAQFHMSNNDLIIDFGFSHNNIVKMTTRIIMSPNQAKVFSNRLNSLIETYDKKIREQ
ncbi:MAG TPA: DUF3467 domain-containing protein [Candidatus Cloacimonetes bacterium]|nr:DUF3467 domain-containing protein [Candidatus Cloacimonadota bacterium]